MPRIASLQCSRCGHHISADAPQTVCPRCAGALYVRYDMDAPRQAARKPGAQALDPDQRQLDDSMWRYRDVLPAAEPVTLGEGWTPMLRSRRYPNLWIKEEAANPSGTCKARGLSMAVSMAKHYGLNKLAVASAGSAAGALAAYAAAAGVEAHIFMPRDVSFASYLECVAYGAHTTLVDGPISACAHIVAERREAEGWFDISALREPFRLEGEKTMGYELVEQLGWEYPDAVLYPTGGDMGLIGMWKAFEELEQLGWIGNGKPFKRPKMIAVQNSGHAPQIPGHGGDSLVLEIARESGGLVLDYPDEEILRSLLDWSKNEGLLLSPEGAAATAAYDALRAAGFLTPADRVVLCNTDAGFKYTDLIAQAMHLERPGASAKLPARMPVGGIITPQ